MTLLYLFWLLLGGLIVYHHVLFPFVLPLISARKPTYQITQTDQPHHHQFAVVVPVYNEEDYILQKLDNLLMLDYPCDHFAIYLLCDGCSDDSVARLQDFIAAHGNDYPQTVHLKVFEHNRGKIAVLNDVLPALQEDVILLTDVSALLPIDALDVANAYFQDSALGVLCPAYELLSDEHITEKTYWTYQRKIKSFESQVGAPIGAHGAAYFIRQALFEPLADNTINDDVIIPMKAVIAGHKAIYTQDIMAYESEPSAMDDDLKRRQRLGAGNLQQILALKDLLHPRFGWLAVVFFSGKLLRGLMPAILAVFMGLSFVLAGESHLAMLASILQTISITMVVLYHYRGQKHHSKLLKLNYYILGGYAACGLGIIAYLNGRYGRSWRGSVASGEGHTIRR